METLYRKVMIDGKEENLPKEAGTYIVCRKDGYIFQDEYFAGRNSMTRWTDYIDWYFQPMGEKTETAEKMLEDGINDGTYARILDAINVNMGTPFLNAVIQFAEDYAAQSSNVVVQDITDEEIEKWYCQKETLGAIMKEQDGLKVQRG